MNTETATTIAWTKSPTNPFLLLGEPGGYSIQILRTIGSTGKPMLNGSIRYCRVFCGVHAETGYPKEIGHGVASIVKAKALAERHAQTATGRQPAFQKD